MPTSTITNTIKDLSGSPVSGVEAEIPLQPKGGFRIDDSTDPRLWGRTA